MMCRRLDSTHCQCCCAASYTYYNTHSHSPFCLIASRVFFYRKKAYSLSTVFLLNHPSSSPVSSPHAFSSNITRGTRGTVNYSEGHSGSITHPAIAFLYLTVRVSSTIRLLISSRIILESRSASPHQAIPAAWLKYPQGCDR